MSDGNVAFEGSGGGVLRRVLTAPPRLSQLFIYLFIFLNILSLAYYTRIDVMAVCYKSNINLFDFCCFSSAS